MHLVRKSVHDVLKEKGILNLYHANSVLTACQFLKKGSLMSRGVVERLNLKQTTQTSDDDDKTFSLWFDVFADTVDIHNRKRDVNLYGPVLFVIDPSILQQESTGRTWVTKCNPTKFNGKTDQERWFQNKSDLRDNLKEGEFDQMLVFRHCGGELKFEDFIKEIIVDDPGQSIKGADAYSIAIGALTYAMGESGIVIPIRKRKCRIGCSCRDSYESKRYVKKMFYPDL